MNRKKLFDFATGMRLRLREAVFPQTEDRTEDIACSLFIACCALGFLEVNGFLPQNMQPVNRPDHFIDASKSFSRWFPDIFRDDLYECVPEDLFGQFLTTFFSTIPRDEMDFGKTGSIESIGWMYQYYVSELHDDIIDPLHTKIVQKKWRQVSIPASSPPGFRLLPMDAQWMLKGCSMVASPNLSTLS